MASFALRETRRKRVWSDEFVIGVLLRELYQRRIRGESASTVHHLSTLPGMPTQRDERIKRLLENVCERGLVSRVKIGQLTGYEMNEDGERWWRMHEPVFRFFWSLRQPGTNP